MTDDKTTITGGWVAALTDKDRRVVYPLDDLRPHDIDGTCWCGPWETGDGVIVHNSMDQRETYERGRKSS